VILLPNGNYALATVQPQVCDLTSWGLGVAETCLDHVFQELSPLGAVVGSWDTSSDIPPSETTQPWRDVNLNFPAGTVYDPWHYNSIEWTGDGFVISFRHLDAVYKIDAVASTGSVVWKLGGTPRVESLDVIDDPLDGFSGQHDARWHSDGSVTLHDNGTNGTGPMRQPRAVRYAIDISAGTATLVEDVRDAGITSSFCCGSTRRLSTGNWVTGWGGSAETTENAPDGTRVFRLRTAFVYRTVPLESGELDRSDLRAGMDTQYTG
jgi:arylsulfotransferase ASST